MTYSIEQPFIFIIFGASGDLAKLKIFPSLYELMVQNRFPKEFYIIGFSRSEYSQEQFRSEFEKSVKEAKGSKIDHDILNRLLKKVHYFRGQYDNVETYKQLRNFMYQLSGDEMITKVAYFSVPPSAFETIIENLGKTRQKKNEDLRLVIEKPFGEDTKSAQKLYHFTARFFKDEQVYLLDHYLGKAAVQSILHLRHGNRIFNQMMRGTEIANIQITAAEEIGVKERAGYFDQVGTLKDMVQSHLLQVLAMVTMSIPVSLSAESIQREKTNILSSLIFARKPRNLVLGQYKSYKNEKDVPADSRTETFVALRLLIDRESWFKVPIYIRTGKKLKKKHTYIVIEFRKFGFQTTAEEPNRMIIELQPKEQITLRLINRHGVTAEYEEFKTTQSIAYSREDKLPEHGIFILDIIRGRKARFLSFPEIIATWKLADNIVDFIKNTHVPVQVYRDGSNGPEDQHIITSQDKVQWFEPK